MKITFSTILTLITFISNAQQHVQYPDFLRAWNNVEVISNPASISVDTTFVNAKVVQKLRTGPLKKIGFKLGVGEIQFKNKNSTQAFRAIVFSETEGPYISRPRWYGNYAYQLKLAEDVKLSLGASYGYVQNRYEAATVLNSENGVSDGGVGVKLQYKSLSFGASSMQLFNNSILTGEKVSLELSRYYTFTSTYGIDLTDQFRLNSSVYSRLLPQAINDVLLTLELEFNTHYSFGIIEELKKGMAFYVQFNQLTDDLPLSFLFLYRSTLFAHVPAQFNHYEIGVGYSINR